MAVTPLERTDPRTVRGGGFTLESRGICADEGGFSLIELLAILVIIGILTVVTWPRLSTLAPIYRLEGAARSLAMELQRARGRAIAEGKCFMVVLDTVAKTYQVQSKAGSAACGTNSFSNDAGDPNPHKIDDAGTLTVSSTANPVFEPRGTMAASTGTQIILTNRAGAVRSVYATEPTGRIRVQ